MPAKKHESARESSTRRQREFRLRQSETNKVTALNRIPPVPEYFDSVMAAEWSKTCQKLLKNGLLVDARLSYLEQFCVLRAQLKTDPVGSTASLHAQLQSITKAIWSPTASDRDVQKSDNPFLAFLNSED